MCAIELGHGLVIEAIRAGQAHRRKSSYALLVYRDRGNLGADMCISATAAQRHVWNLSSL